MTTTPQTQLLDGIPPFLASPHDFKTFRLLREAVKEGKVMAFVGAGLSARAGFGDWSALIQRLSSLARSGTKKQRKRSRTESAASAPIRLDDMSWMAEDIRDEVPSYLEVLRQHFGRDGNPDAAIEAFAELPFTHVFTTNYDKTIERAIVAAKSTLAVKDKHKHKHKHEHEDKVEVINWLQPGASGAVIRSFDEPGATRVIYLHGHCDQPETIVLSERDYRAMYVRSDETIRRLFAVFTMRKAMFVGFSLTDMDVLSVFRQVVAARENSLHFAIMSDPGDENRERERARFTRKFGISPVYYIPGGPDYPNLLDLLQALNPARKIEPPAGPHRFNRGRWVATPAYKQEGGRADENDWQKGRFGGSPICNGRKLSAKVEEDDEAEGWYVVTLEVSALNRKPLKGTVVFWLHPSFGDRPFSIRVHKGVARFTVSAYGAFTVGATADAGRTPLELDLAQLPGAPEKFRVS